MSRNNTLAIWVRPKTAWSASMLMRWLRTSPTRCSKSTNRNLGSKRTTSTRANHKSIVTNLSGDILLSVATQYSLRIWIEYGFKQVKHELGWHDYRLTDYNSTEYWWEIVLCAYLLVSLYAVQFKHREKNTSTTTEITSNAFPFRQHPHWEPGTTWRSALNNLRLLLQPY